MKLIDLHKRYIEWWQRKLSISDYALLWVSFFKGILIALLVIWLVKQPQIDEQTRLISNPISPPNPLLLNAYNALVASCSCLFFSALYGGWIVPLKNRIDPKRHRGSFSVVQNFDTAFTGGFTQIHLMPMQCAENVLKLSPFLWDGPTKVNT